MYNMLYFRARLMECRKKKYKTKKGFIEAYDSKYKNSEDAPSIEGTYIKLENQNDMSPPETSISTIANICDLLDCDIDYLCGRIDNETHSKKVVEEETGLNSLAVDYMGEEINGDKQHSQVLRGADASIGDFLNFAVFMDAVAKNNKIDEGRKLTWIETYITKAILYDGSLNDEKHKRFQDYLKGPGAELNAQLHHRFGAGIESYSELYETCIHRAVGEFENLIRAYIEYKSKKLAEKITASGAGTSKAVKGNRKRKSSMPSDDNTK